MKLEFHLPIISGTKVSLFLKFLVEFFNTFKIHTAWFTLPLSKVSEKKLHINYAYYETFVGIQTRELGSKCAKILLASWQDNVYQYPDFVNHGLCLTP
jgi:hypothetical protein